MRNFRKLGVLASKAFGRSATAAYDDRADLEVGSLRKHPTTPGPHPGPPGSAGATLALPQPSGVGQTVAMYTGLCVARRQADGCWKARHLTQSGHRRQSR